MTQPHTFCLTRIRFPSRSWQPHWPDLDKRLDEALAPAGGAIWGAFSGLFGVASNELFLLTHGRGSDPRPNAALADVGIVEQHLLTPTARPAVPPPALTRPGVYVFRYFDVATADVDEVVALSREAWVTFEDPTVYASEPLGLFAPADRSTPDARMVLLTWYDGFGSWERSRTPAPAASANFARRHQLTRSTVAFATALVGTD
jgi:hypothetical protein